jgi:UDP-galactopyranose mutase
LQETTEIAPNAAARQRVPGYQDKQMLDALDYIGDRLESAFAGGYTDDQWQSIVEHLAEHVQNGLA